MYRTLFDLAGLAIFAWLPLIFLPGWRWTRRLAESAVFPAYLSVLYLVGITAVLAEMGPGIMGDFGNVEGVLALLRTEGLGLVAWIHILAFDQVVGVLIYRDNVRHRFVPLPVQSVILFFTLMFGPVGFLAYWLLRTFRRRGRGVAWGERWDPGAEAGPRAAGPARFRGVRLEPDVALLGVLGVVLAGVCAAAAALHGDWFVEPEGRLLDALRFELGSGVFFLTMAFLVPLAGFTERARRRWVGTLLVMGVYFLGIEVVQAARGLDPRFTEAGGVVDQVAGLLFGGTALLLTVLTVILALRFFRADVLPDRPALRTALRYGFAGILLSFAVGFVMTALRGRFVGESGNLMPLHAAGLHGIQAVPLVALLASRAGLAAGLRARLTHLAGLGWIALSAGLLLHAMAGLPPASGSVGNALAGAGALAWMAACGVVALKAGPPAWRGPVRGGGDALGLRPPGDVTGPMPAPGRAADPGHRPR